MRRYLGILPDEWATGGQGDNDKEKDDDKAAAKWFPSKEIAKNNANLLFFLTSLNFCSFKFC